MKRLLMTMVVILSATMMFAKDIRTLVLTTTPQMHCARCENRVKAHMKDVKGISFIMLDKSDIVRHKLVTSIVEAYEKFDEVRKSQRDAMRSEKDALRDAAHKNDSNN